MDDRLVDDSPVPEVLDDNSLQHLRRHVAVPDSFRIHDDNRPAAADAEAWRLAALDAAGAEEQSFTLEEHGKERVECATCAIGRAESARADQHVSRVRLHWR